MRYLKERTNGGFLISQIKQIQGRVFEKMLVKHGISEFNGAQGRILFILWEEDEIPIKVLSQKTGLAKTTLTGMLDRLEALGHIRRTHSKDDRRTVIISLTNSARGLKEQYEEVSAQMNEVFYKGFSNDEILDFEDHLRKVLKNLTERENDHE